MFNYNFRTSEKLIKDEKNGDLIHINSDGEISEQFNSVGTLIYKGREYSSYDYDDKYTNIDKYWYNDNGNLIRYFHFEDYAEKDYVEDEDYAEDPLFCDDYIVKYEYRNETEEAISILSYKRGKLDAEYFLYFINNKIKNILCEHKNPDTNRMSISNKYYLDENKYIEIEYKINDWGKGCSIYNFNQLRIVIDNFCELEKFAEVQSEIYMFIARFRDRLNTSYGSMGQYNLFGKNYDEL